MWHSPSRLWGQRASRPVCARRGGPTRAPPPVSKAHCGQDARRPHSRDGLCHSQEPAVPRPAPGSFRTRFQSHPFRQGVIDCSIRNAWRGIKEGRFEAPSRCGRSAPHRARGARSPGDLRSSRMLSHSHGQGWQRRGATAARGRYQSAPPCACRDLHNVTLDSNQITPSPPAALRSAHFRPDARAARVSARRRSRVSSRFAMESHTSHSR